MYQEGRGGPGMLGVSKSHCRRGGLQDVPWSLKTSAWPLSTACSAGRGLPSGRFAVSVTLACLSLSEPQAPPLCREGAHRKFLAHRWRCYSWESYLGIFMNLTQ